MPKIEKKKKAEKTAKVEKRESLQGWGAVAKRQEVQAEAQSSVKEFWLKAGESATIQFLQDEPYCYDAHNVKDRRGNFVTVPCGLTTSTHCALCTDKVKQTWKAAFMLLDYRGTWDTNKKEFRNDKPFVKIWRVGSQVAQAIKQFLDKRSGKELTELVITVTRSGEGKNSSYNFEQAYDEETDKRLKPIEWEDDFPTAESLCQPPSEDEIDEQGYQASN